MCESDLSAPFKMQSKKWANIIQNDIQNRGRTENGIATLGRIGRACYVSCFVDTSLDHILYEFGDPVTLPCAYKNWFREDVLNMKIPDLLYTHIIQCIMWS